MNFMGPEQLGLWPENANFGGGHFNSIKNVCKMRGKKGRLSKSTLSPSLMNG